MTKILQIIQALGTTFNIINVGLHENMTKNNSYQDLKGKGGAIILTNFYFTEKSNIMGIIIKLRKEIYSLQNKKKGGGGKSRPTLR